MSSGKRASRFLKDTFTVLRFCFQHASLKCFFFSFSGSLRHERCMGNYISILYHNSVISTKNSENWVTFCASLQSLNCNFNMQYANERPKQFPINGRTEDCIPLMRINWLIAQRYQILPFYGRFLPGFNFCKFWAKICASRKTVKTLIWFWQANCLFTNGMRLETARKLLISHASMILWHFVQTTSLFDFYNSFIATFMEFLWI